MEKPSNSLKFLLGAAAFVIIVAGLKAAETLIVPFMLSVFIALICSPPLVWLKTRGVHNGVAIMIIVGSILCVGFVVGAVIGNSVSDFRQDLPFYQEKLADIVEQSATFLSNKGLAIDLEQIRRGFDPGVVMQFAGNTLASLGNMMTNVFMIMLTVIFILAEEVDFNKKLAYARKDAGNVSGALHEFANSVNRYLGLKTVLSLLTGALVVVGLWIIGVDYPVMWGLLAFLLNYIPTVGSILAAIPAVLLALIQLGSFGAMITGILYVFVNIGVGNVLEPKYMGRGLNLSPLVVFLSLVFWGWVLGPVGMLLSIPLTIMVKIGLESDQQTRWLGVMLGGGVPIETEQNNQETP